MSDSVNDIGEGAFENCINLTKIDLSKGVTIIGRSAFEGCKSLMSVIGGVNIKCISDNAYYECESLTSFDLSDNVETIGNYAFYGCLNLGVVIPPKLRSIGKMAFYKCWLKSISIPKSLTNIDKCAFKGCFFDCEKLDICVEKGNPKYDSRDNCNAIIETNSNTLIIGCATTIIPNGVTRIGDEAFSECDDLFSITIPAGVTHIGKHAFSHCYKLCSVSIPESMTSIEEGAFYACYKLVDVSIDSLESWCNIDLGGNGNPLTPMRQYSTRLLKLNGNIISELIIPNTATTIKDHAFEGCYLTAVVIPNTITSIGSQSFGGCSSLKSIALSSGITSIGDLAFYGSNLSSLVIPKSIINIGSRAFWDCDNIGYITILGNPTVQENAFSKCKNLRDIYCYSKDPLDAHNAFGDTNLSLITLHVPVEAIDKYKESEIWCKCGSIVPIK